MISDSIRSPSPLRKCKQPRRLVMRAIASISTNVRRMPTSMNAVVCPSFYICMLDYFCTSLTSKKVCGQVDKYICSPTRHTNAVNMWIFVCDTVYWYIIYQQFHSYCFADLFRQYDPNIQHIQVIFTLKYFLLAAQFFCVFS